jgi:hypothetical protein
MLQPQTHGAPAETTVAAGATQAQTNHLSKQYLFTIPQITLRAQKLKELHDG